MTELSPTARRQPLLPAHADNLMGRAGNTKRSTEQCADILKTIHKACTSPGE